MDAGPTVDVDEAPRGADSKCLFFHRTGVIMADGEVVTCANMYAAHAGQLDRQTSFLDVWNGDAMQSVRGTLGTEQEWSQCRSCWFREIRYHAQREAWDRRQSYSLENDTKFTDAAWDFTGYGKGRDDQTSPSESATVDPTKTG